MKTLFSPYVLKNKTIKNRIVFPPVVCFRYAEQDGYVSERNIEHYRQVASGGAGIIITEATAVWRDGRLAPFQLGLWDDRQIDGMSKISSAIRAEGALALLQIHHAGIVTPETVNDIAMCPSADPNNPRSAALTAEEIRELSGAFISAAKRAKNAGFEGIELHGAHGYLLNQFASSMFNKREDEFGGTPEKNLHFALTVVAGIREACGPDFIIGYRLGANSPTLDDGIRNALILEAAGADILHVSHGGSLLNLPRPPKGFDFNWIVYSGTEIRNRVGIPVIVVNEIRTAERAEWLLSNNMADFVALGRSQLADPYWVKHIQTGEPVNTCLQCKPKCKWYEESTLCPARKIKN